ncbi:MAG: SIS domain-containing protein [Bacteroidia bacterium]|nr:SIS domain-containing protein [Bacteroidia bacterium]
MITHQSSLENFTSQIKFVIQSYIKHGYSENDFSNILIGGMGGSGIGARIAKSWFFDKMLLPIEVIDDYNLPAYANSGSLVILCSYSGETEETVNLLNEALAKNCKIICITTGGHIEKLSIQHNLLTYKIEKGYQPRMAIGYNLAIILMILGEIKNENISSELEDVIKKFEEIKSIQIDSANKIYSYFKNSLKNKFVIVADRFWAQIATRFCQQLNENSKLEGFVNILPESNHNVIESYYGKLNTNFIFLYSDTNPRVHARFDFLGSHLELENNKVLNMFIPENTIFSIFDVIYRLDWASLFLGEEHGYDPMKIDNIMELKDYLSNLEIIEETDEDE